MLTNPSHWSLAIKSQVWTEDTENEVEFLIKTLELTGRERILDLACAYGRHALAFARRGYPVVGVDIAPVYIDDARKTARKDGIPAEFILADVGDLAFREEFDVVLNLADGAIGYFDTDQENLKLFDGVARALKPGGKHFMDICNAAHAEKHFPKRHWASGKRELSLAEFQWDASTRKMCFQGCQIPYGEVTRKPSVQGGEWQRLYSMGELEDIFSSRAMEVVSTFSDYRGTPASEQHLQLMVYSVKG